MKLIHILIAIAIFFIVQSCAPTKLIEQGKTEYNSGSYENALATWEQVIAKAEGFGKQADTTAYYYAGASALKLKQTEKARKYLEKAEDMQMSSPGLYNALAEVFKSIDNLSYELDALVNYHTKFPNAPEIESINMRLFQVYIEIEEWQKAADLWPSIEAQAQDNVQLLEGALTVNKKLDKNDECDKIATAIQKLDADNIAAMEWIAEKYFWKAENTYVSEMKAYEKTRTNKQYKKLLKAWDRIWPDFRKSRDYFLKLYKIEPKSEYAMFLHNIYKRMKKDKEAKYYYKKWKNG